MDEYNHDAECGETRWHFPTADHRLSAGKFQFAMAEVEALSLEHGNSIARMVGAWGRCALLNFRFRRFKEATRAVELNPVDADCTSTGARHAAECARGSGLVRPKENRMRNKLKKVVRVALATCCSLIVIPMMMTLTASRAAAQESCQTQYNNCMASVEKSVAQCQANFADDCDGWEPGSMAYMYCEEEVQQQEEFTCGNLQSSGDAACSANLNSCNSGSLDNPFDRLFRKGLPPVKLPAGFVSSARRSRQNCS